jgi:hypothetical protein
MHIKLISTKLRCHVFPKSVTTMAGIEPLSSVPQTDAMTNALTKKTFDIDDKLVMEAISSRVARWFIFKPKIPN